MKNLQSWLVALVVLATLPELCLAKSSLEERIERVENALENKITLDTLNEIENLKTEVQALNGRFEEQKHEIELLTQKQEKLFLDLEQRINQFPKNNPQSNVNNSSFSDVHSSATKGSDSKSSNEQEAYNFAYKLLNSKNYKEASTAFQDFLWQFPNGKYVANAYYWLGEIYLFEWNADKSDKLVLEKAINSFKTVVQKYPNHQKSADSLLKLGIIEADQEHWKEAKEYFNKIKKQYPGSSMAHMANIRLQKIK